jgi:nucleotide-binding universal stress UspA family protein
MFSRILVPVDIHEIEVAREAIESAIAIAKAFGSTMRLVSVASPIPPVSPLAVIPQTVYDEIGVYEKTRLDTLAAALDRPPESVSTVVRVGGVYPEVLAEAEEWRADLIVVGAHRRSMATFLLGSTAAAVSRHAQCTVMIVRSHLKAKLI